MTLSVAWRRPATFPARRIPAYWAAQLGGAFLAAAAEQPVVYEAAPALPYPPTAT